MARSRNRKGTCLTLMVPVLLAIYLAMQLRESYLSPPMVTARAVSTHDLPPLQLSISCLLEDASGKANPVCAYWSSQQRSTAVARMGLSLASSGAAFPPIVGLSLGGNDSSSVHTPCGSAIPRTDNSLELLGGVDLDGVSLEPADFGVGSSPWARAGQLWGMANELLNVSSSCDVSAVLNASIGLLNASRGLRPASSIPARNLGVIPLCPWRKKTLLGAFKVGDPAGGLGFVIPTPPMRAAGAAWHSSAACSSAFSLTIAPSPAHGILAPMEVRMPPSESIMDYAVSGAQRWDAHADLAERMPLVDVELQVSCFVDEVAGSRACSAEPIVTFTTLSAAPISPIVKLTDGALQAMESCGILWRVTTEVWETAQAAAAAVASAMRAAQAPYANTTETAIVALLGLAANISSAELAVDQGLERREGPALQRALAPLLAPGLLAALAAGQEGTTSYELQAHTLSAWQRASSGCGFVCTDDRAYLGTPLSPPVTLPFWSALGRQEVSVSLQRHVMSWRCTNVSYDLSLYPPQVDMGDAFPSTFYNSLEVLEGSPPTLNRGPALSLAVVFSISPAMTITTRSPTGTPAWICVLSTLAQLGSIIAALLVLKRLLDLFHHMHRFRKMGEQRWWAVKDLLILESSGALVPVASSSSSEGGRLELEAKKKPGLELQPMENPMRDGARARARKQAAAAEECAEGQPEGEAAGRAVGAGVGLQRGAEGGAQTDAPGV